MSNKPNKPDKKGDEVITPGGSRSRKRVHSVAPDEAVVSDQSREASVVSRSGLVTKPEMESTKMPDTFVLTPGGYRHQSLVRRVEAGHALRMVDRRMNLMNLKTKALTEIPLSTPGPEDVPALGSGWISYAYWNNGTGHSITSFSTTWRVPNEPSTQSGQTIFLFNGIQNYGANYGILQPVLQWGVSAAGGGNYWSVANWYVTSGGDAFHSPLVRVNVGDTLVGVMTLTGQANGQFSYTSDFPGIAGTSLNVQNIAELLWCNETLEAYGVQQCSDYPNATRTQFQHISIETGKTRPSLTWTPVNRITDCGQHTVVVNNSASNGEVDIYYENVFFTRFTPFTRFTLFTPFTRFTFYTRFTRFTRITPFTPFTEFSPFAGFDDILDLPEVEHRAFIRVGKNIFDPKELELQGFQEYQPIVNELARANITHLHQLAAADPLQLASQVGASPEEAAAMVHRAQQLLVNIAAE